MPTTDAIAVSKLRLDLKNYRTVPQQTEIAAIQAMISISPAKFWGLMESLLKDGYLPTENIVVLKDGAKTPKLIVKEGNRRIAALKLILGKLPTDSLDLPSHIKAGIENVSTAWKSANKEVPCALYEMSEEQYVDRIVEMTHGKGETASRDGWTAVAKARHDRDHNGASEPGLDLLEKYLRDGKNLTADQKERWAGKYPLTVLDEALKKIASRLGFASSRQLADEYPKISQRSDIEDLIRDIGLEAVTFPTMRSSNGDFAAKYNIPAPTPSTPASGSKGSTASGSAHSGTPQTAASGQSTASGHGTGSSSGSTGAVANQAAPAPASRKTKAVPLEDPRAVIRQLKQFHPKGRGRDKIVSLLEEARTLNLEKHVHSFCFLLRSMFELSAKAYCADHAKTGGPKTTDKNNNDRKLVEILRDVVQHLTGGDMRSPLGKELHGAMSVLASPSSLLSVTSMNQLVHNPQFSITTRDLCVLFGNVFPLLSAMNR